MADKKVDVGVRLKMEQTDAAASEVEKLRKRVLELEGATKKTETSFLDFAKQAAAMAIGVNLMPAIHQMTDFAKSIAMASVEGDAADTAIAGLISSVQGIPWDKAKIQAQGFGDDLDEVSAKAGVMGDDLAGAFQAMLELKGATDRGTADAMRNVEQVSTIAGVLGKSAEGLSREFGFMSEGVLKTRGQLFQLLQTTGIFGDNTKKAAEYWGKLTEESRIKALEFGLSKVADSMAKATPSSKQLLTSIQSLYETGKERLGDALMAELVPVLTEVKTRMMAAIPVIEKFAKTVGPEVGRWVSAAVTKVEEGFKYLQTHSQEIHDAIVSAYEKAKAVVDFIIRNKDVIAIAFGAKAAMPAIGMGVGAAKAVAGGIGTAAATLGAGAGPVALGASIVTFGLAVAAFAAAVYALEKMMEIRAEKQKATENQLASLESISKMAEAGNVVAVEKMSGDFKRMATAIDGELDPALRATLDHIHSIAESSAKLKAADVTHIEKAISMAAGKMQELPAVTQAQVAAGQTQKAAEDYAANVAANQAAVLIYAYNEASLTGNKAAMQLAANTIAGSDLLKEAFLKSSMDVQGGLEGFADVVLAGGSQFAGFVAGIRGKAGAKVPAAPAVHMSGGQTFKITQDFREQDPDKIALIFERDIVKLAENRIQARTTIPFGG